MKSSSRIVIGGLAALIGFPVLLSGEGFVLTGSMVVGRREHCAVRLADGRVLVAGGSAASLDAPLTSAEIYDPITETFALTGSMSVARGRRPECVLLNDGRVLVMGGAIARFSYTETAGVFHLSHQRRAVLLADADHVAATISAMMAGQAFEDAAVRRGGDSGGGPR